MPAARRLRSVLLIKQVLVILLLAVLPATQAAEKLPKAAPGKPALSLVPMEVINDRAIFRALEDAGARLFNDGLTVKMSTLISQLDRNSCAVKLAPAAKKKLTPAEIVAREQAAVLVVAVPFKCDKCPRYHFSGGTGFMVSEDGVFATAYHVVDQPKNLNMLIMTGDGRIARVTEVLAANRRSDVALLRAEGSGFAAAPLSTNAPVGSPIWILSHPDDHFYTLSEGIVSRYYVQNFNRSKAKVNMLAVTADFAKGSSGGPVFNEFGAVVGMVSSTVSSYYTETRHGPEDLQMVFKNCVTARHILELIR